MKKIFSIFFATVLFVQVNAQITAYFSRCTFSTPQHEPYIETYISIFGNSILYKKNAAGKYQGVVEVGVLFSQNGKIKASKKYNLMSPEQKDTLDRPPFIDQQRFKLDTGTYDMEVMVTDKNLNGKTLSIKDKVKVAFSSDKVNISDVALLTSFEKAEKPGPLTKNGLNLIPYVADFFPDNITEISFYAEIYNTDTVLGRNEKYIISYFVESYESKTALSKFAAFKKETTAPVSVLLTKLNIAELTSGNYNLVVEVRNKTNELVQQKKVFFQRKNTSFHPALDINDLSNISVDNTFASKITGKDTLAGFIRCLTPISSEAEKGFIDNQLKLADERLMQQFFYNFWQSRYLQEPEAAWYRYYQDVVAVNKNFGAFNYQGFETDRGRVYLQYGPPDKRQEYPSEPNAYPYEIWLYYRLVDKSNLQPIQTNKQFIFFNRDLVSNNYRILHSDARGETKDARWQMKLHSRTVQSHDFEDKTAPDHFGGNSSEEFSNPK